MAVRMMSPSCTSKEALSAASGLEGAGGRGGGGERERDRGREEDGIGSAHHGNRSDSFFVYLTSENTEGKKQPSFTMVLRVQ